ncbi:unnamed protein product [Prorocentrum cordatum]|uniref:Uncharacterized protein n=1 Tax=Prorocentrum cordatum TaxID=2364126 RepID=A0ABN9VX78_9DINO|nr:unnamed protein product [Polarella glacialis]
MEMLEISGPSGSGPKVEDLPTPRPLGFKGVVSTVDRHIKQLEKKLNADMVQYERWKNWLDDKREPIAKIRVELRDEVAKYEGLVEQLSSQLCAPDPTQQKTQVTLQELLSGNGEFLDLSSVESAFGVDGDVYDIQDSDRGELAARSQQLREQISNAAKTSSARLPKISKSSRARTRLTSSAPARSARITKVKLQVVPPIQGLEVPQDLMTELVEWHLRAAGGPSCSWFIRYSKWSIGHVFIPTGARFVSRNYIVRKFIGEGSLVGDIG